MNLAVYKVRHKPTGCFVKKMRSAWLIHYYIEQGNLDRVITNGKGCTYNTRGGAERLIESIPEKNRPDFEVVELVMGS